MMILLTGGSANGKSYYAEKLLESFPKPRCYVAAMKPEWDSSGEKIARQRKKHEEMGFICMECFEDIAKFSVPAGASVLLECVCHLTSNEMFRGEEIRDPLEKVAGGIESLARKCENLIVVTNEVGSGQGSYDGDTVRYLEALGKINRELAKRADCVCEIVCGIPIEIKKAVTE